MEKILFACFRTEGCALDAGLRHLSESTYQTHMQGIWNPVWQ